MEYREDDGGGDEAALYREVGLRELTAADLIDAPARCLKKSWCKTAKRWLIPAMCVLWPEPAFVARWNISAK